MTAYCRPIPQSGVLVKDEGSLIGRASVIDVVGAAAGISLTDGVATLTVSTSGTGMGPTGPTGPAGSSTRWYTGTGVPSDAIGSDGDLYLDTATGDVYEKSSGSWF